jgi:hypothetical protein
MFSILFDEKFSFVLIFLMYFSPIKIFLLLQYRIKATSDKIEDPNAILRRTINLMSSSQLKFN